MFGKALQILADCEVLYSGETQELLLFYPSYTQIKGERWVIRKREQICEVL